LEYDHSLGGDAFDGIETIEHVLPQSPDASWKELYGETFIEGDQDALANLVPCTGKMNSSLGNQPYATKKQRFAKDSKFKSTREFSNKFDKWNRTSFLSRSDEMGTWAVKRWPHERLSSGSQNKKAK
jgi:hypothetical protein